MDVEERWAGGEICVAFTYAGMGENFEGAPELALSYLGETVNGNDSILDQDEGSDVVIACGFDNEGYEVCVMSINVLRVGSVGLIAKICILV